jgi:hypothetical protein
MNPYQPFPQQHYPQQHYPPQSYFPPQQSVPRPAKVSPPPKASHPQKVGPGETAKPVHETAKPGQETTKPVHETAKPGHEKPTSTVPGPFVRLIIWLSGSTVFVLLLLTCLFFGQFGISTSVFEVSIVKGLTHRQIYQAFIGLVFVWNIDAFACIFEMKKKHPVLFYIFIVAAVLLIFCAEWIIAKIPSWISWLISLGNKWKRV